MTKEHLLSQAQHGLLLYTVSSSLCHGPGRLGGGLAQLSLAQTPSCSGLLEKDNAGRESKSQHLKALHPASPSFLDGMSTGWAWCGGWSLPGLSRATQLGSFGKGLLPILKPYIPYKTHATIFQQPTFLREMQLSSRRKAHLTDCGKCRWPQLSPKSDTRDSNPGWGRV